MAVVIHSAELRDRDSAELVLEQAKDKYPRLKKIWVDAGYEGQDWHKDVLKKYGWEMDVVSRKPKAVWHFPWVKPPVFKGFKILKWRWIVERSLAWLTRWRRTSKDYEYLISTSATLIYAIMLRVMTSRLARQGNPIREVRYPIKP